MKILGYTLLFISCVAWAILPLLPFLSLSGEQLTAFAAGLFIFAEVTWWLAMPLLGKEIIDWLKSVWPRLKQALRREPRTRNQVNSQVKEPARQEAEKDISERD